MKAFPLEFSVWSSSRLWWAAVLVVAGGCASEISRSQSPDLEDVAKVESGVRLVGDLAGSSGLRYLKVEGVALCTELAGTGSDPPPTPQRSMLMADMQGRGVLFPNRVLASPSTSLVLVRAFVPPGVQKGDRIDVEVVTPARSETTSLRGGWLMQARLKEFAVLGNEIHTGHVIGLAQGRLLVDSLVEGNDDPVSETRGRILGGGMVGKSRPVGLVMRTGHQSVRTATLVGAAINRRFHTFDHGRKIGVAKPMRDNFIELIVHPRYKHNLARYMRVVASIPVLESPRLRTIRKQMLKAQLLEPTSAATAALRLEALGKESVPILLEGLKSEELVVRFYSAEALAYLDREEAAEPLARMAREEPALRWYALTALSVMNDMAARDALVDLLDQRSAETRYGAFRALLARSQNDPIVRGEVLDGRFAYHLIDTSADPMIHVTRSRRSEVVVFGVSQRFQTPLVLLIGRNITVKSTDADHVLVSRFSPGEKDRFQECSAKVDDVIRALVKVGATYPEVVEALQQAKRRGYFPGRVVVDAVPRGGRTLSPRKNHGGPAEDESPTIRVANPLPNLFASDPVPHAPSSSASETEAGSTEKDAQADDDPEPWWDVPGRMRRWRSG